MLLIVIYNRNLTFWGVWAVDPAKQHIEKDHPGLWDIVQLFIFLFIYLFYIL